MHKKSIPSDRFEDNNLWWIFKIEENKHDMYVHSSGSPESELRSSATYIIPVEHFTDFIQRYLV